MKWPYASLTDHQVRDTYFIPPEFGDIYTHALGAEGYRQFKNNRQAIRASGGELLLIGWPDGMTITLHINVAPNNIDLLTLVETYQASAAIYRASSKK